MNPDSSQNQITFPVLKILSGSHKGKQFRLLSSEITLGRHSDCDVIFKNQPGCSDYHAKIQKKEDAYWITSLDPANPVLINKKIISSQQLNPNDKINIGSVVLLFTAKKSLPSQNLSAPHVSQKKSKSPLTPPRIIMGTVLLLGLFLFISNPEKEMAERQKLHIKTEAEILKQVEKLQEENEESTKQTTLTNKEKAAQVAFIKGFRDYRKGYFHRALKQFQHCLTLDKKDPLCRRYVRKSEVHIDNLIQKKIRLGNAYKKNGQYDACQAAFKSVEVMIQDPGDPIYKEVVANRKACEIQLKNKI